MNNQSITKNIKIPDNTEILKKHFSHCFDKNGKLDFEKLKQEITQDKEIHFSKESYGMNWLGKSYARLLASDEANTLLTEDTAFNQKTENKNSGNLLIKGDNLEVLKHLSNAYYEKIKMIYIDPPYNTGSDGFVYEDNRKFTVDELSSLAGIDEESAKRILDFTMSKSNSHSAWLTFMYPRLYIAKKLLKDDGVIFISIDDNEVAQIRLLMDEIFGEDNFVAQFVWKKRSGTNDAKNLVSSDHEYILCYGENQDILLNGEEKTFNNYKNPDNDSLGNWTSGDLTCNKTATERPNLYYSITDPKTGVIYECNKNRVWRTTKDKMEIIIKKNKVIFPKKINGTPMYKRHQNEVQSLFQPISSLLGNYLNANATKELRSILGEQIFSYPKSSGLIKILLKQGTSNNDIILDFFAGSGTTADAVMQLNAEDGGNRKYILVQLPEPIDPKKNKTAYDFVKDELHIDNPTIFEITKERLLRASKKIQKEKTDLFTNTNTQDFGFRIFETMSIWDDYDFESDELESNQKLFNISQLTEKDINALTITWKTYDGIPLTQDLQKIDLDGYTGHYANNKLYIMDKDFKTKTLVQLLEKIDSDENFNPTTIIAFGYHFESTHLREIAENIKNYANKKSLDITFIERY